jgi:hypothetical protein
MKRLASSLALALLLAPAIARADEPAPIGPPTAPTAAPADGPVVELSADDERATIERRAATSSPGGFPIVETGIFSVGHWQHACVAPCRLKLDPRYSYRVAGDGLVPTDSFALPQGKGDVRVDAKMGSSIGRVAGVLATTGGLLAIAAGGAALVATPILESEDVGSKGFRTAVLAGGIGAVSVGVVSATVGLFLWLTNGSSAKAEALGSTPRTTAAR